MSQLGHQRTNLREPKPCFVRFGPEAYDSAFRDEAKRSETVDPQIAFFYLAWAKVLAATFLDI
jgi:hypothetical protein